MYDERQIIILFFFFFFEIVIYMIDEIENNYSVCYMESRRGVEDTTSTISHMLAVVSMGIIMASRFSNPDRTGRSDRKNRE